MAKTVLEVKNLTRTFGPPAGGFTAVDDISFSVKEGEIVGLLGPNGAGKTTTIQMLLGLLSPTAGSISYFGKLLEENKEYILHRINNASGYSRLPWRLTIEENLKVYAHLYQVKDTKRKLEDLVQTFDLAALYKQQFWDLSAGQKTRVLLAKAFINDPEVVLLDEPTAALDPDVAERMREFILKERKKRNMSILITSHNMMEVEEMCDRVVFLNRGKIFAEDTPEGLANKNSNSELQLMVKDGLKRLIEITNKHEYGYQEKKRFITITLPEKDIAGFLTEMGKRGVEYNEIEIVRPSLEDFFLSVSKEAIHG